MIFNAKQCYWDVTETSKRKKSLTKHAAKCQRKAKKLAKNSCETRRLLNHIQGYRRAKDNWDNWIWNRASPSRVWFGFFWLRCRCSSCPENNGPNWQLHWINSMSITGNISELRRPRRCLKDVGGEPTSPTGCSWLIADLGLDTPPSQNPNFYHPSRPQWPVDVG